MNAPAYEFRFNWDDVDSSVRSQANLRLTQLLSLAPPGAKAVGVMNKEGKYYVTAVEVISPYRDFYKKAVGLTPESALEKVLERLEDSLYRWRYGGGGNEPESGAHVSFNQPLTQ